MSLLSRKLWLDGKVYNILKTFNPVEVQEYGIQMRENVYERTFKIPMYYCQKMQEPEYRECIQEIKQESELTTLLKSPRDCTVTISSQEEQKVGQGIFYLHRLLSTIRDSVSARQFLAVPVLNEEIHRNFLKFKEVVLKSASKSNGIDESIFQKASKLHLSINVFSLLDELEVDIAKQTLEECKTEVVKPFIEKGPPLKLEIRGIDCMQGNLSKVHVLYGKAKIVNETEDFNIQTLFNNINDFFYQKGLTKEKEHRPVKIHMTLINSKYRKSGARKHFYKRFPINATEILSQHKDFYFGQCDLSCVHLCLISSSVDGGYYKVLAQIDW